MRRVKASYETSSSFSLCEELRLVLGGELMILLGDGYFFLYRRMRILNAEMEVYAKMPRNICALILKS